MEDDLKKKMETSTKKMEDDQKKNGRQPQAKLKKSSLIGCDILVN